MLVQKMVPTALRRAELSIKPASFAGAANRLFGLDAGDWSILVIGLALAILLASLV
jgi:hypothetical protein